MTASLDATDEAPAATPAVVMWFDFAAIDAAAHRRGITTDVELAVFLGLDRSSLYRFRRRQLQPSLATAMRVAERLELTVETIIIHAEAA